MAEQGMPTTYETRTTTTGPTIGFHPEYIRTIPGILKIVEIALDLIVFICAVSWPHWGGTGWVQFVSMSAFLTTLIYFILYLTNAYQRVPGPWTLVEFIYYCVFTVFYLIAAIVAAVKGHWHASIGAAAFFAFAATAVYAVDTFFQFRAWRSGQTEMTTTTTTTTTTAQAGSPGTMEQGKVVY